MAPPPIAQTPPPRYVSREYHQRFLDDADHNTPATSNTTGNKHTVDKNGRVHGLDQDVVLPARELRRKKSREVLKSIESFKTQRRWIPSEPVPSLPLNRRQPARDHYGSLISNVTFAGSNTIDSSSVTNGSGSDTFSSASLRASIATRPSHAPPIDSTRSFPNGQSLKSKRSTNFRVEIDSAGSQKETQSKSSRHNTSAISPEPSKLKSSAISSEPDRVQGQPPSFARKSFRSILSAPPAEPFSKIVRQTATPFIPFIQPIEVPSYIEILHNICTRTAQQIEHARPVPVYPKIFFQTRTLSRWIDLPELSTRPDGFVCPHTLNPVTRLDPRLTTYGETRVAPRSSGIDRTGEALPDLFSRSHEIACRSNGKTIIVTLYRDTPSPSSSLPTKTHVFVSPCSAVDLVPLGTAALAFRDELGYLFGPQLAMSQMSKEGRNWFETVESIDSAVQPETQREVNFTVPLPTIRLATDVSYNGSDRLIGHRHLQYLLSQTARVLLPNISLEPDAHDRFQSYDALFHTYPRGCTSLHEEIPSKGDDDLGVGHDMQTVCARTGGLGCTFEFHLQPDNDLSCTIHCSWQFWELHRKPLADIATLICRAISPGFLVPEIVTKVLKVSNLRLESLPFRPAEQTPKPVLTRPRFDRCRLTDHRAEAVWPTFPTLEVRAAHRASLSDRLREAQMIKIRRQKGLDALVPSVPVTPASPSPAPVFTPRQFSLRPSA